MMHEWEGAGPEFTLAWGGRTWSLDVAGVRPGLRIVDGEAGPLLGLEGIAAVGRWEPDALSGASLTGFERRFERVEATYVPPGWDGLTVRAAWGPSVVVDDAVDLEVQVSALSVDRLKGVEVKLASVLPEPEGKGQRKRWVEPRDARSAALTYDGREPDLRALTTLPLLEGEMLAPRVLTAPWPGGGTYVEIVHPHDAARRITETSKISRLGNTTRYGLFGHDLEKGVVLRARLRAYWTDSSDAEQEALARYERFLREPPPLGE
jgi:hypothetical protein